jgi:N-glycosylase/DNA lyase
MVSRPFINNDGTEDPKSWVHESVNSCLRPLASVHRTVVTTVRILSFSFRLLLATTRAFTFNDPISRIVISWCFHASLFLKFPTFHRLRVSETRYRRLSSRLFKMLLFAMLPRKYVIYSCIWFIL